MSLPEPHPAPSHTGDRGKLQKELASLLADIARARAALARQSDWLKDLQHRLDRDLRPWESKLAEARRETLRILGRQYREGWLGRRDGERLRDALRGLADELETGFGLDLSAERERFLDQKAVTAGAERSGRQARLDALREAIRDEDGPREAAARAQRERLDVLRKALRGEKDKGARERRGREERQAGTAAGPEDRAEAEASDERARAAEPEGGGRRETRAQRRESEDESAFTGDLRALYVLLARALHPDKEPDPARREAKTAWMQKVTAAYAARDLAKLLDILAQDPLGSVGPYLSAAPLASVKGFAKRLRRELSALQAKAELGRSVLHPSLRKFLGPRGIDDAEVKRYAAALKKEVRFVKERNQWYQERAAVAEMLKAMGADWRGYL